MPANLSPEYKAAEAAFRAAREPKERLECLREMLRTIPKHKGTEHLQADIKRRIRQLTEELREGRRGGSRTGPSYVVRPEGAAQIALLGAPNAGKSALHARLTGSHAEVAPYPFTTQAPQPGMMPFEDIHFQLVDLPPVSGTFTPSWIVNALQPADAAWLVLDLADPDAIEATAAVVRILGERRITLTPRWPGLEGERKDEGGERAQEEDAPLPDPFAIVLPTLLVGTKADRFPDPEAELEVARELLEELTGLALPALAVSAETGHGLERLGRWLFEALGVVRVYTKAPGRPPDLDQPFTVRRGDTVLDVAWCVHKEIAERLRFARLWGSGSFEGQQVSREHPVSDRDVVELHTA